MTEMALTIERPSVSPTQASLQRLLRSRSFMVGATLVILMALVALFADALAPFDPLRSNARMRLTAPITAFSTAFWGMGFPPAAAAARAW